MLCLHVVFLISAVRPFGTDVKHTFTYDTYKAIHSLCAVKVVLKRRALSFIPIHFPYNYQASEHVYLL